MASLIMVTREGCSQCVNMKNFLKTKKMQPYAEEIGEVVMDVIDKERYDYLRSLVPEAMGVPILIRTSDNTLFNAGFNASGLLQKFVNEYGKK